MKKYSWIVALLLALSFTTLFISCGVDALDAPEVKLDFEDYPLDAGFNTWGGGAAPGSASQQGWATDGFEWTDGKTMAAKKLGYELEAFQKARNLVLEFEEEGTIGGGISVIWGGYSSDKAANDELGGWNSTQVVADNGTPTSPFATLKGTTLTIDITTLKDYAKFTSPTAEALRFVLAHYSPDIKSLKIKEAYLQIPTDDAFVPVEKIELNGDAIGYYGVDFKLDATVTPSNASNQTIVWSIMGWLDSSYTVAADTAWATGRWEKPDTPANITTLKGIVDFKEIPAVNGVVDDTVYPWVTGEVIPASKLKNVIIVPEEGVTGTVKVRATIIDGKEDAEGKSINAVQEFDIVIKKPPFPVISTTGVTVIPMGSEAGKWPLKTYLAGLGTKSIKYLLLASLGGSNEGGYGTLQMVIQVDGSSAFGWAQKTTGDWTGFAHKADPSELDIVWFVFDVSEWGSASTLKTDSASASYAQFMQNGYGSDWAGNLGLTQVYAIDDTITLTKPTGEGVKVQSFNHAGSDFDKGATTFKSYITNKLPGGLTIAP